MGKYRKRGSKVVSEVFDFQNVVNKHIDRMNYVIVQNVEFGIQLQQKAVTLKIAVKQLENQLSFLLDDDYTEKLKKIIIPPISDTPTPEGFIDFFEKLSDWQQLLFAYAYTKKLIKTPLEYDEFMETPEMPEEIEEGGE